ncbi:ATP-binding protein [Arthrobacter globiformis]|uniref:ATP-binding protein n=1 Tax=Arthrobacter globiformis TaxID=1665 RepID=A0A328HJ68_ARTGO|nr:ATP-binding protein [Arthrobacter globiformis]RAM38659.1 ATP-binding protein [Arthrobacter globiformis]
MAENPSLAHLLGRVGAVEERIRLLVAMRRAEDPQPDDPFRGLYLSDEAVDRLLGGEQPSLRGGSNAGVSDDSARQRECEQLADAAQEAGHRLRLRELAGTFGLSPLDVDLLLVALAADLDPRFEQFFGYLNDDVTRRRPSVAVALALCGEPLSAADARARLLSGPLISGGLLAVEDPERPLPGRSLRVPDRVVGHLLGDDAPEPGIAAVLAAPPSVTWGEPGPLAKALKAGIRLAYLREPATGSGRVLAAEALRSGGYAAIFLDLMRLAAERDPLPLVEAAVREARLRRAGLVAAPLAAIAGHPAVMEALHAEPQPVLLVGHAAWDPAWTTRPPLLVDVPASTSAERTELWRAALGPLNGLDVEAATSAFRLRPEQVVRAAGSARVQATLAADGRATGAHLRAGARAENGSALDRLARRVEPVVGWADLVLPDAVLLALQEVALRAKHREKVLGDWSMRPGAGRGHGVAALFAGDSGTGKTMSAEVVARELGLDLYVVDLATVVDKYVGETEKNLERIFTAAAGVNGVLLFDEADAVFGRRSEVKDAHDRYANIESAYLLQRMETFDGLAILATNLRANIDEAFTRRLDVLVDFPLPDAAHRSVLWERCLKTLKRSADIDFAFLGKAFELAGGAIRSAAVTAAYLAADDGGTVTMRHLVTAVQREYRKLGRLTLESEFGQYWGMLSTARGTDR